MLAEHGLATGLIAQKISRLEKGGTKLGDECLLAGLLHDVGKLVLAAGLPEEYGQVLATARTENLVLHAAELAVFEATHAEIGAYLAARNSKICYTRRWFSPELPRAHSRSCLPVCRSASEHARLQTK